MADTLITEIVTIISVATGAIANSNQIKKLKNRFNLFETKSNERFQEFESKSANNAEVIKDLLICNSSNRRIDANVSDIVNGFLSHDKNPDNSKIAGLIQVNADAAKDIIKWVVETNLSGVTKDSFMSQYERFSIPMRNHLSVLDKDFAQQISGTLGISGKKMVIRVNEILTSEAVNNKVDKIVNAIEYHLNIIIHYIVEEWIKHNSNTILN
jgi:hypothetical protein